MPRPKPLDELKPRAVRMSDAEWNAYTFDEQFNAAAQTITVTTDSTKNDY